MEERGAAFAPESKEASVPGPSAKSQDKGGWKGDLRKSLVGKTFGEQQAQLKPGAGADAKSAGRSLPPAVVHPGEVELKTGRFEPLPPGRDPDGPKRGKKGSGKGGEPKAADDKAADDKKPVETETGLATTVSIGRFVGAARSVQTDWAKLDKNARAKGLGDAANAELSAASVPGTGMKVENLGTRDGELQFQTWDLALGEAKFSQPTLTDDDAAAVSNTVYHEARHAEQWHRMARIQAGKGQTAEQIATDMFLPKKVAEDAAGKALKGDTKEAKEGAQWLESVYGTNAAARNTTLGDLGTKGAAVETARQAYDKLSADYNTINADAAATDEAKIAAFDAATAAFKAWDDAYKAFDVTYKAYRALPEEQDAWAVGGKVEDAYKAKK